MALRATALRRSLRPLTAALWMTGSIFSFTAMAIAARSVSEVHDTFEIMMWRSVVGFCLVLAVAGVLGRLIEIRRERLGQHLMRNMIHFTGQNLWFWALTMIPLAQVFALEFTSPIWVILLSPLVLGEKLTRPRLLAPGAALADGRQVVRGGGGGCGRCHTSNDRWVSKYSPSVGRGHVAGPSPR